jgi:hypothetical protein
MNIGLADAPVFNTRAKNVMAVAHLDTHFTTGGDEAFHPTKHIARLLTMVVEQQEHNTYSQG